MLLLSSVFLHLHCLSPFRSTSCYSLLVCPLVDPVMGIQFWMIEPEMAFADINDNMECAEAYLKYCVEWSLKNCRTDIEWFDKNVEEGLIKRLENVLMEPFARVSYTEAVDLLQVCFSKSPII